MRASVGQYTHCPGQGNGFVRMPIGETPEIVRMALFLRRISRSAGILIFFCSAIVIMSRPGMGGIFSFSEKVIFLFSRALVDFGMSLQSV